MDGHVETEAELTCREQVDVTSHIFFIFFYFRKILNTCIMKIYFGQFFKSAHCTFENCSINKVCSTLRRCLHHSRVVCRPWPSIMVSDGWRQRCSCKNAGVDFTLRHDMVMARQRPTSFGGILMSIFFNDLLGQGRATPCRHHSALSSPLGWKETRRFSPTTA